MGECSELQGCRFFNETMHQMPTVGEMMKNRYCLGDFSACARYRTSKNLGSGSVPVDLAPNDHKRADKLIAEGKA